MAGETIITVVGNVTADPELRFTANGAAVANFTVASTPRTFDRQANEFRDGETLFLRCSAWREMAENVAESVSRGTRVIVQGRLRARTFDTNEGEKRTVFELDADEVGPSLRFATANVTRNERGGNRGGGQGGGPQGGQGGGYGGPQSGQGGSYGGGQGGYGGGQQGGFGGQQGGAPAQQGGNWGAGPQQNRPPQDDPWAASNPQQGGGWGSPANDEPPF